MGFEPDCFHLNFMVLNSRISMLGSKLKINFKFSCIDYTLPYAKYCINIYF
jgi:hypothetical protein